MSTCVRAFGLATALLVAFAAAPAAAATLDFKFKTKADAKGWQPLTQKWNVKDKAYRLKLVNFKYPFTFLKKPSPSDLAATVVFELKFPAESTFGAMLRTEVDPPTRKISGYFVAIHRDMGTQGTIQIVKYMDLDLDNGDSNSVMICEEPITINGDKHTLKISAKGDKLKATYNDQPGCKAKDADFEDGVFGLLGQFAPDLNVAVKQVTLVTPD